MLTVKEETILALPLLGKFQVTFGGCGCASQEHSASFRRSLEGEELAIGFGLFQEKEQCYDKVFTLTRDDQSRGR